MKVVEAQDIAQFNQFVEGHPLGTIHQMWQWGEFQAKTPGRDKFWPLHLKGDENDLKGEEKTVASALIIRQSLPFGKSWLYCPRGPLVDYSNSHHTAALFDAIAKIAKQENAVFLRFDPPHLKGATFNLQGIKTRRAHAHYQPESTLIINLTQPEEAILKQMKPKGRYNIKIAQKHGVTIQESQNVQTFYRLFSETAERDNFAGHSLKYYQDMLETLGPDRARLFLAKYQDKPVAGAVITYFGDTATYYFGASTSEHRNIMAPYLLHWEIMRRAKADGYKAYDLFGIAPEKADNHPWAGVTEFKLKFGGTRLDYADAREVIYKPIWYWIIRIAKFFLGSGRR